MAIAQAVAGAYRSTYNGVAITGNTPGGGLGFNDDNGYEIEQQTHGELIDRTDLYGQSLLDWIHQGGNVFCTFTCMTWQTAPTLIKNVFYPWGSFGVLSSSAAPIGRLASNVAQALTLTAVAGTPAAVALGPATLTAPKAILPPGSNNRLMFSSRVRKVPCRLAFLPIDISAGGLNAGYLTQGLGVGAGGAPVTDQTVWFVET